MLCFKGIICWFVPSRFYLEIWYLDVKCYAQLFCLYKYSKIFIVFELLIKNLKVGGHQKKNQKKKKQDKTIENSTKSEKEGEKKKEKRDKKEIVTKD